MSDQHGYSARFIRFVLMPHHAEAFRAAYLDQSSSSRNELLRLSREYETLPPRHSGWCPGECPAEVSSRRQGLYETPCLECRRLRQNVQWRDIGREVDYGRHPVLSGVVPNPVLLDIERAIAVLGQRESAYNLAAWLNGAA